MAERWDVDYTNKTLGAASIAPDKWRQELAFFRSMETLPRIGVASGGLTDHQRWFEKIVGVDPTMAEAGENTQVLSAPIKIRTDTTLDDLLPDCPITPYEEMKNPSSTPSGSPSPA